jgi:hypothetical protein
MNKIKSVTYLIIYFACLSACVNDSGTNRNFQSKPETHKLTTSELELDSSIKIYATGDNKFVLFDTLKFKIPGDIAISATNIYAGVYELKDDSFVRHKFLTTKKLIFLTTFEDLGFGIRGRLYVFDIANRSLIRDSVFNHDYLYSSAGIFIIETESSKVFVVGKPEWYEARQESILPAGLFVVKRGMFKNEKNIYQVGSDIPSGTKLLSFFKNAISVSGNGVLELPKNWWQTK